MKMAPIVAIFISCLSPSLACFLSAPVAWNPTAVDRTLKLRGLAGAGEEFTMAAAAYNLQLLASRVAPA